MHHQQDTTVHIYHGRALTDLPADTVSLQIFCPELTPASTQGRFGPGVTTNKVSLKNATGTSSDSSENVANHIVAEWFGESNRAYAPNVVAGEQVVVYQFGNADKYYWCAIGRDRELRKTERLRFEVGNTTSLNEEKTDKNTYFWELSSLDQHFLLRLSRNTGEAFAYTFKIDAKNGMVVLTDDTSVQTAKSDGASSPSNSIMLDSAKKIIQITNASKAVVSLNDQDVLISAPRDVCIAAKRQIIMDAPLTTLNRAQSGSIVVNCTNYALNATDCVFTTSRLGVSGAVKLGGPVVTGALRALSVVTGPVASLYAATTSNLSDGSVNAPSNTSDTDTAGGGDRNLAAWPDVNAAFEATAAALEEVAAAAMTTVNTSGITKNASSAKVSNVKGGSN